MFQRLTKSRAWVGFFLYNMIITKLMKFLFFFPFCVWAERGRVEIADEFYKGTWHQTFSRLSPNVINRQIIALVHVALSDKLDDFVWNSLWNLMYQAIVDTYVHVRMWLLPIQHHCPPYLGNTSERLLCHDVTSYCNCYPHIILLCDKVFLYVDSINIFRWYP